MERINLYALYKIALNLDLEVANSLSNKLQDVDYIKLQIHEYTSLDTLIEQLAKTPNDLQYLRDFNFGYKINQIGKEFDLLKVSDEGILNIELKSSGNEDSFKKQLINNRYYLNALNKPIYLYTYNAETNKLYTLVNEDFIASDFSHLIEKIAILSSVNSIKIDDLFDPNLFLVSPLNNTTLFLSKKYFLTSQQYEIKLCIYEAIKNGLSNFFSITGKPGTGKTLLLLDMAIELSASKKVCFVHCGILSKGHAIIGSKTNVNVFPIKDIRKVNIESYDYVLFDESQRMFKREYTYLQSNIFSLNKTLIFSHDPYQILSNTERNSDTSSAIESIKDIKKYNLTNKIRTNPDIIRFVQAMLEPIRKNEIRKSNRIKIYYSRNDKHSSNLIKELEVQGYKYIKYTPSNFKLSHMDKMPSSVNSHQVIGQEFDKVVLIINNDFFYYKNVLIAKQHPNPDYIYTKLLYQSATRAKNNLALIVQENNDVLKELLNLLD